MSGPFAVIVRTTCALWLGALLAAASLGAAAEPGPRGGLDAVGPNGERLGACPLQHTDVRAEISGFVVSTKVVQQFANPFEKPIEAVYTFPLPDDGAVYEMWIRTGGQVIRGEIHRREEARQIYENARRSGQLAALLDEERPNIFTQAVANLKPGEAVEIEIHYVASLHYDAGSFEFVFPTVVGPRFIPGAQIGRSGTGRLPDTTQVPDASRVTPPVSMQGTRAGHDLSIAVNIHAGVPLGKVESPLHAIEVKRSDSASALVTLRDGAELPNRDFVLRYEVAGNALQSGALVHRTAGKDGYLTLVLVPPRRVERAQTAPRELVFLVDRSGSQSGLPLRKAQETLLWMLDHMNPDDTFQIASFSNTTEFLFEQPRRVDEDSVALARKYIAGLQANGGTWMGPAVQKICSMPADAHRLRIVSLMTDGYVGNDFEVLGLVQKLRGTSRWFPFGTGNSVNRYLLDEMARLGGGESEVVLLNEPGDQVAEKFARRVASPVLTDVRVSFEGLDVYDTFPKEPSDVWAERPLVIHARYHRAGNGQVVLRGYRAGKPYEQRLDVDLAPARGDDSPIAFMWARAKVDALLARDLSGVQNGTLSSELRESIVQVALEHRLVTPFTSFVAVATDAGIAGEPATTIAVPVEVPEGVSREATITQLQSIQPGAPAAATRMRNPEPELPPTAAPKAGVIGRAGSSAQDRMLEKSKDEQKQPKKLEASDGLRIDAALLPKLGPALRAVIGRSAELRALLEEGQLWLEITLVERTPELARVLDSVGFDVRIAPRDKSTLIGTLLPEDLAQLLALDAVLRVELSPSIKPTR